MTSDSVVERLTGKSGGVVIGKTVESQRTVTEGRLVVSGGRDGRRGERDDWW